MMYEGITGLVHDVIKEITERAQRRGILDDRLKEVLNETLGSFHSAVLIAMGKELEEMRKER